MKPKPASAGLEALTPNPSFPLTPAPLSLKGERGRG